MSDSDDTDILLLIPPDFFFTESNLNKSLNYDLFESNLQVDSVSNIIDSSTNNSKQMDPYSNYKPTFLTPKTTKNFQEQFEYKKYETASPSMQTILHSPQSSGKCFDYKATSSTPINKPNSEFKTLTLSPKNDGLILEEIDGFLEQCSIENAQKNAYDATKMNTPSRATAVQRPENTSINSMPSNFKRYLPKSTEDDILNGLVGRKMTDWNSGLQKSQTQNDQLISLASVWNNDEHYSHSVNYTALNEEQLRRRQCERSIQNLQIQLKQYEEKYSDAIKMDQTKNEALAKLHETNKSLISNISELENQLSSMELKLHRQQDVLSAENNELKNKIKQLQDNNERLEKKINTLLLSTNEVREIHRKQMDDIETRLSNAKHNEQILNNELGQIKNQFILEQNDWQKDKCRADALEKQLNEIQQMINHKEECQMKEMDSQRLSLKKFYQNQLEMVVSAKLIEYQKQLDSVEDTLRKEAKQNERTIAERAIKQIELINQKNEQEFSLLNEKQKEENELYRIQLKNAAKIIAQLEHCVNTYKAKRNDIAERLHGVIETQWQKTLEILTNTEPPSKSIEPKMKQIFLNDFNEFRNLTSSKNTLTKVENEIFETPNTSKFRKNNNFDLS